MDKDVRIKQLEDEVAAQRKRIAELEAKIASLTKNSSNSSKPPSSDITKPPKTGGGGRKKGVKKRKRESRRIDPAPFPEERVDQTYDYFFEDLGRLVPLDDKTDPHRRRIGTHLVQGCGSYRTRGRGLAERRRAERAGAERVPGRGAPLRGAGPSGASVSGFRAAGFRLARHRTPGASATIRSS